MRSPYSYYGAFFSTGIATVFTGALVALDTGSMPTADGEIGRLLAAQFGGQLIGSYFVVENLPKHSVERRAAAPG